MTQINDWSMNFRDYKDKTVLIEGYFISINGHYFVEEITHLSLLHRRLCGF